MFALIRKHLWRLALHNFIGFFIGTFFIFPIMYYLLNFSVHLLPDFYTALPPFKEKAAIVQVLIIIHFLVGSSLLFSIAISFPLAGLALTTFQSFEGEPTSLANFKHSLQYAWKVTLYVFLINLFFAVFLILPYHLLTPAFYIFAPIFSLALLILFALLLVTIFLFPVFLIVEKKNFMESIQLSFRSIRKNFWPHTACGVVLCIGISLIYFLLNSLANYSGLLGISEKNLRLILPTVLFLLQYLIGILVMIIIGHRYRETWRAKLLPDTGK